MIDIKFLRENPEVVKENIRKKFQDSKLPLVDEVIDLDKKNRAAKMHGDELRSQRKNLSDQIGTLMKSGKKDEAEQIKLKVKQINDMLKKAFDKNTNLEGLIFHSDQGWQYQHTVYRQKLAENGVLQSMSRKGNCYDNCIIETFFGRMKTEMYYGYEEMYDSFKTFSKAVDEYIDYYNNERIQSKTKWMPPTKYRKATTRLD